MNPPDPTRTAPQPGHAGGRQGDRQAWSARAPGSAAADIEITFDARDRAATVTALLAACITDAQDRPVEPDQAWDWTLNQRLQALIAMRLASGKPALELQAACALCGEAMELALDLHLLAAEPVAPRFSWHNDDGLELALRLPNGRDLQRWQQGGVQSHEQLALALVEAMAGQPPDPGTLAALLPRIDDALAAHDPLTGLQLQTSCPACAQDNSIACDLEALLLDGFARDQAGILDEVVRLASAFHWSEAEILALPRWRRAHYLRQLPAGQAATGAWT